MKIITALKELCLCIKLAYACEQVKNMVQQKESAALIIEEYTHFIDLSNKFIDFEVNQVGKTKQEVQEKINDSMIAQIKQTIQDTPFVKARIQAYESKIGRSYDLI